MMTIDEYRAEARRYTFLVAPGEEDPFVARAIDFPAALGAGDSPSEAAEALVEAIAAGLEHAAAEGFAAPLPIGLTGNATSVNLPKSLYRVLAARAEAEGLSLDATIVYLLAQSLGTGDLRPGRPRRPAAP